MYRFVVLDARKGTDQLTPEEWARTLGIEVTVPALAAACGLGNIDPQHGQHRPLGTWAEPRIGSAAIDFAALGYLAMSDPGGILATVRPDVDSIGAMAVLVLRALGLADIGADNLPLILPPEQTMRGRIDLVAQRDVFVPGAAWAPRPLPTVTNPWPATAAPVSETKSLAPLGVICSPFRGQMELPIAERIAVMACWILWGMPHIDANARSWRTWNGYDSAVERKIFEACGADYTGEMSGGGFDRLVLATKTATEGRVALARAVENGEIKIRVMLDGPPVGGSYVEGDGSALSLVEYENEYSYTGRPALIAIVESAHVGAMGLGYCIAPVVVAMMPAPTLGDQQMRADAADVALAVIQAEDARVDRKATIAAWRPGLVDFAALKLALNAAEVIELDQMGLDHGTGTQGQRVREGGWGGGATILGSPQGDGTVLTVDEIARIVRDSLVR